MRVLRFLVRNWPLKIGAVFLAVVLYVGMVALQSTQVWPGAISIEVVHQPANSYLIKPDPLTQVTSIRYIAAGDVPITRDSFRAIVDLASAKVSESEDSLVSPDNVSESSLYWKHPRGRHCFTLSLEAQPVPVPTIRN